MALTHIAKLFPEVIRSDVTTIVDIPGWLYAQSCETWWTGSLDADPVTVLLVYRSPLVKATKTIYRPVTDMILAANRFEVIGDGSRMDENMIHGDKGARFLVARMTQADAFPKGPLDMDDVRQIMTVAAADALGRVLALA